MRLDIRALTLAFGLLWGGMFLVVGLANLTFPGYAAGFLEWAASFYPGYDGPSGFGSVILVTLYGLVDGGLAGLLLAWLYNRFLPASGT